MARVEESGLSLFQGVNSVLGILAIAKSQNPVLWLLKRAQIFVRRAYTDPYFTGLMEEAYKEWQELEEQTGVKLVKYDPWDGFDDCDCLGRLGSCVSQTSLKVPGLVRSLTALVHRFLGWCLRWWWWLWRSQTLIEEPIIDFFYAGGRTRSCCWR